MVAPPELIPFYTKFVTKLCQKVIIDVTFLL